MSLSQGLKVVPPTPEDKQLIDFSGIIQRNLDTLFQSGHIHVGVNGVLSAAPTSKQGNVGDIMIGVISGVAYLFVKTDSSTWWKSGVFTKV